jgi:predicted nuclease of restriction endonuclease-like (RecB) superfamily
MADISTSNGYRELLARLKNQIRGRDLHQEFPSMQGFSPRNLKYMRAFAEAWPEESIVQQAAAQLPWFHNCVLLDKVKGREERICRLRFA